MDETEINQRFRISDTPVSGELDEIGELTPYKSGTGYFRNVVIRMPGGIAPILLPITMFAEDAVSLDPKLDLNRTIRCTARLTSRRYLNRDKQVRWILSMSAINVMLGPRVGEEPAAETPQDWPDDAADQEDMPF